MSFAGIVASDVFVGGAEGPQGTSNYRIPGFTVTTDGTLLAFAEGRRNGSDPGAGGFPIDLVMKRSTDLGATWEPLVVLQQNPSFDYDDPAPVVDTSTGAIHLIHARTPDNCGLFCVPAGTGSDSMSVLQLTSVDDGQTWSAPVDITAQVKDPSFRGIVPGPGSGIQLKWQTDPARNGRLVIPGSLNAAINYVWYSDDQGSTWQSGGLANGPGGNENEVVELTNGDLMMNARQNGGSFRRTYRSNDGGSTWQPHVAGDIAMTTVDSSLIRYSAARDGDDRDRLLFSAPLGPGRNDMAIWTSYDEGNSFINPVQVADGWGAYSVLAKLPDDNIGLLYEATGSTIIRLLNLDLTELEQVSHAREMSHYDGFTNEVDPLWGGIGWTASWDEVAGVVIADDGGLEFPQFELSGTRQRATTRGGSMRRTLGKPIDLSQSEEGYVSVFVRHDNDGGDASANEALEFDLQAGDSTLFSFGVNSREGLFVRNQHAATTQATPDDRIAFDESYFLLMKLEASDSGFDQIFLASYQDFESIPSSEAEIEWELSGVTGDNFGGQIDGISLSGGVNALWNIDELRIGSTFESVLFDNGLSGVVGDLNLDGVLDASDAEVLVANWLTSGLEGILERVTHGDMTLDGRVDLADVFALHEALQDAGGGFPFQLLKQATVPEPGTLLLAGMMLTVSGRRLRDQR